MRVHYPGMIKHNPEIYKEQNLYLQEQSYTCGPSSIKNVQRILGAPESDIEEIITLTKATPQKGSANKNIVQALQTLNFETQEHTNATIADMQKYLHAGHAIITNYINALHDVGHYAAIDSITDTHVHLRDSSIGLVQIKHKHFERLWHDMSGNASQWFVAIKKKGE